MAGLPKVSRLWEASAAVVDVRHVGPRRAVAVGTMADDLDLVVHAFEGAVTDPELDPDQDAIEMSAEHPGQLLERGEAAVAGAPEPLQEMPARPRGAAVRPKATEILLEEVRLHDGAV